MDALERAHTICVSIQARTVDEFVATFHRFCEPASFFVATGTLRPIGFEIAFSVQLRDGERMLRGVGPVLEAWAAAAGSPFGRPGIRIGIKKLTPSSAAMFTRLRDAARAACGTPKVIVECAAPIVPIDVTASAIPIPLPPAPTPAPRVKPVTSTQKIWLPTPAPARTETRRFRVLSTIAPWTPPHAATSIPVAVPVAVPAAVPVAVPADECASAPRTFVLPANPLADYSDDSIRMLVDGGLRDEIGAFTVEVPDPLSPAPQVVPAATAAPTAVLVTMPTRATTDESEAHRQSAGIPAATAAEPTVAVAPRARRTATLVTLGAVALVVIVSHLPRRDAGSALAAVPITATSPAPRPPPTAAAVPTSFAAPVAVDPPAAAATAVEPAAVEATHSITGCQLAVNVSPASAAVRIDGRLAGHGAFTIATPCRRHRVTANRMRFQTESRWIMPTAGTSTELGFTLHRPTHSMIVSTQPGGATVYVDGHRAGVTPMVVRVVGYTETSVKIEKPGYKRVVRAVYSTEPRHKLAVRLIPALAK